MRLPKVMVPVLSSSSVSTSPAASTARPEVASTLKRTRRSMPAMPIADSRPPMVVGISVTSSATSTTTERDRAGIDREATQRDHRDQEDQGEARQQHGKRQFVGGFLALGALDQRDHAVDESRAGLRR